MAVEWLWTTSFYDFCLLSHGNILSHNKLGGFRPAMTIGKDPALMHKKFYTLSCLKTYYSQSHKNNCDWIYLISYFGALLPPKEFLN